MILRHEITVDRVWAMKPWTVASIRHIDVKVEEGELVDAPIETIAQNAPEYLGVRKSRSVSE